MGNVNQATRCLRAALRGDNASFNSKEIKEALQNSLEATGDEALTFNEVEAFGTGVSVRLGVSWPTGNLPSQCDRDSFNVNQATRCLRAVLGGSNGEQASYDADEIRTGLETTDDNSFSASELEAFGSGLAVRLGTSLPESYPQVCKRRNFNINQAIRCLDAIFGDDEVVEASSFMNIK